MAFIEDSLEKLLVSANFGSELLSNKDQCTRAQKFWVVPPQVAVAELLAGSNGGWAVRDRFLPVERGVWLEVGGGRCGGTTQNYWARVH